MQSGERAHAAGYLSKGTWKVTGVDSARVGLSGGLRAPGDARRAVEERFTGVLGADALASVQLLVTELVSNAVRHGGAAEGQEIALHLATAPACIRVEVCDPGPGFEAGRPQPYGEGGYGLFLVDEVASRWGVSAGDGTCTWFELDH